MMDGIFFDGVGPRPREISAPEVEALGQFQMLELYLSYLHKVELTAIQTGDKPIYAVRRWVLIDERTTEPLQPPDTDVDQLFRGEVNAAIAFANDLAARTSAEDARLYL